MLTVNNRSLHYRIYAHWRSRIVKSEQEPKQLDLCRYMRTVMIYVPGFYLAAGILVGVAAALLTVTFPIWIVPFLIARYTRGFQRTGDAIAASGRWLGRGVTHSARKAERWVPYFLITMLVAMIGFGIYLIADALTRHQGWDDLWFWTIRVLVVGFFAVGFALILGFIISVIAKDVSVWWANRPVKPEKPKKVKMVKPAKPKKEKQPSVVWAWIKAKKKKVCPLITVNEEINA